MVLFEGFRIFLGLVGVDMVEFGWVFGVVGQIWGSENGSFLGVLV